MASPSYEELLARVEDLEQRSLGLKDLPLAALQRKLENDWHPEAGVLLGENSITPAMLASALNITSATTWRFGQGNITWPGGSAESNLIQVNTGLPSVDARFAAIIPEGPAPGIAAPRRGLIGVVFDYNSTKPQLTGRLTTLDAGLNPAALTANDYFWMVIV